MLPGPQRARQRDHYDPNDVRSPGGGLFGALGAKVRRPRSREGERLGRTPSSRNGEALTGGGDGEDEGPKKLSQTRNFQVKGNLVRGSTVDEPGSSKGVEG